MAKTEQVERVNVTTQVGPALLKKFDEATATLFPVARLSRSQALRAAMRAWIVEAETKS